MSDIPDEDFVLPGETRYRMHRDTRPEQFESQPVFTEKGTIERFQKMLIEVNKIWSENKSQLEAISKKLPRTAINDDPKMLALVLYMANRAERARASRKR